MSSLTDKVREIEREEILNALKECNWVMSRAARILGITERLIGYKVRKYKIRKEADNSIQQVADSRQ
jgi:transcriptional regulator with GAF, ATPase, and Fis domain